MSLTGFLCIMQHVHLFDMLFGLGCAKVMKLAVYLAQIIIMTISTLKRGQFLCGENSCMLKRNSAVLTKKQNSAMLTKKVLLKQNSATLTKKVLLKQNSKEGS
jgi:hypothetical protein